jgi:cytochrome c oxidase subunit 1
MNTAISPTFHVTAFWPRRWLALGVTALGIAGIFALLLATARTPQMAWLFGDANLFSVALVIHVDLSVLVWMLSVIGMGLSHYLAKQQHVPEFPYLQASAFWCMLLGTVCIASSPLHDWDVVMSNYIPVIVNPIFFLGLSLIAASMLLLSVAVIGTELTKRARAKGEHIWWQTLALTVLVALAAFVASAYYLPKTIAHNDRYEFVFWAGGHTLQFAYSLIAMLAWLALLRHVRAIGHVSAVWFNALAFVSFAGVVMPLSSYVLYEVDSVEFQESFTQAMIYLGGIAPSVLLLYVLVKLLRLPASHTSRQPAFSSLVMSMLVFGAGGIISLFIEGQNTIIPAHYHGSIVGITLALMGYAYVLLLQLGFRDVSHSPTAYWQPYILGIGQLLHVGGLAYSGGYGVLRKQAAQGIAYAPDVKIALGCMGGGALLATIGGFMFVLVMWRSMRKPA